MKTSSTHYRVVNAVLNTLRHGDSVFCASGGNGGAGESAFTPSENLDDVQASLLDFDVCTEIDRDDLLADFSDEIRNGEFDFYELKMYGNNGFFVQLAIEDSYYVDSYELRDIISDMYQLECAEITEGRNGYPHNLRGCVLLGGNNLTIDEMQEIANKFGVELVSLRRKDGWDLWEKRGWTSDLYDYERFLNEHDDNTVTFGSYAEYANYLRETAEDVEEDDAQDLLDTAESVQDYKLGDNEFIWIRTHDITDYDTHKIEVDHFSFDTWNYELALDCSID